MLYVGFGLSSYRFSGMAFGLLPLFIMLTAPLYNKIVVAQYGPDYCQACGYNLGGLTSDRCPECGAKVPDKKQA
jgi:hypothetical protein